MSDENGASPRLRVKILKNSAIAGGVALVYAFAVLWQKAGFIASADSVYHFTIARRMAKGELAPSPADALPWTVFSDMPVDHYWGYHLLVSVFAHMANGELGMKLASALFFALLFGVFAGLLTRLRVPYAPVWALLPCLISTQDWRYLMLRGGQWMVALVLVSTAIAFTVRDRRLRRFALFAIAYVGMLSYHGAVTLLPFHIGGVMALWVAERFQVVNRHPFAPKARELVLEPLLTLGGLALGLTLNPYMDSRASTWRFARLHIFEMGTDTRNLYTDQIIAEFRPFPPEALLWAPIWLVLLLAVLSGFAWVVVVVLRGRKLERDEVLAASLAALGVVLTARAVRMREYAVPLSILFFAVLSKRAKPVVERFWQRHLAHWSPRTPGRVLSVFLLLALAGHAPDTIDALGRHLPIAQYEGSRDILVGNGSRPILNLAEADCGMMLWEYEGVVCVHGLSRYFLDGSSTLYRDVWELHRNGNSSSETPEILDRFYGRGVRLMATHRTHAMHEYAEQHPERFERVFLSPKNGASLWKFANSDDGP